MLINSDVLPSYIQTDNTGAPVVGQSGGTNPWKGSVTLLVTPWVA
jgi:hypothetical protein